MKASCSKCKAVFSITNSPNKIEGYFITQELYDVRQSDLWGVVESEEGNQKVSCQRCPECGHIEKV